MTKENFAKHESPLDGLKVIELGSTVAGPFCGRLLADFGANVIKVEQKSGDAIRGMGKEKDGVSLYAASIMRGKKLVSIDMNHETGRSLVKDLCVNADIVVENFRPGKMEEWGLGYENLSELNPGIVMVRISGYGQDGPYSQRPGYGVVCEAFSGMREITGDPDRPPARGSVSLTDYITGLYAALGAVMAIHNRNRTGLGQVVDTALYESAFSFMEPHIPAFEQLGFIATRTGSKLPNHTPNNLYKSSDNHYIHIAAGSQSVFKRLAEAIEKPELQNDERFNTQRDRSKNEHEIDYIIGTWVASKTINEVEKILGRFSIPASKIFNMKDIFDNQHYKDRNTIIYPEGSDLGPVAMSNVVPRLSRSPGQVRWAGRNIGHDTKEVLSKDLGLNESEIQSLLDQKIIF